jgi:hypothetical protein
MKYLLCLIYFYLSVGCNSQKVATSINGNLILPLEFHLVNRMPTCDQSVLYMKSVILPNKENTKIKSNLDTYYLGEIALDILNDKNKSKIEDLHLFYINLDCLEKMPKEELFKLLLNQSDYNLINKFIEFRKRKIWKILF